MIRITGKATGGAASTALKAIAFGCLLALTATGCIQQGDDTLNENSTDGTLTGSILNLISHIRVSGEQPFTVVYSASEAATGVSAFYVEVDSATDGATEVGDDVVFATGLPSGENRTVTLNVGDLPLGIYKIGLSLIGSSGTSRVLSTGTIEVTDLPAPTFSMPNQNLAIVPGNAVEVRATVGDPENAVQWRLFYVDASESTAGISADNLGNQIASGSANEAIATWNTGGAPLGTYRIGISVTDSGQSIAATVASGDDDQILTVYNEFQVELVSETPPPRPPSLVVSQPSSDRDVIADETVLVEYSVTVFEGPPSLQTIDIFFDMDGIADTGDEQIISGDLPVSTQGLPIEGNAVFSAALIDDDDTVYFGVTVDDARNEPVTQYANGKVTRVTPANATLEVLQPSSPATRDPDEEVNVLWQANNLPLATDATYSVLVRRVDDAGSTGLTSCPTANDDCVGTTGLPLTQTTWSFPTFAVGRFRVSVLLEFEDGETPTLEERAPALVTVSTLPTMIWLGDLVSGGAVDGAVFEGVQFEDNAGSAFEGGQDYNDDGFDEFLVVARYAKPFFDNPSGVGVGEAYLIAGQEERYTGRFNLNSTSSNTLPGLVFTGLIPTEISATATDGIARVFITGDADGDELGELAFGFPNTWSQRQGDVGGHINTCGLAKVNLVQEPFGLGAFEPIPHFRRGGVVVFSSRNQLISDEGTGANSSYYFGDNRINLDEVGQDFSIEEVRPEFSEGGPSVCNSEWMEDRLTWDDSQDCDGTIGVTGCVLGSDGEAETLVRPNGGFDQRLAGSYVCREYNRTATLASCVSGACPACDDLCDPLAGLGGCTCNQSDIIDDPTLSPDDLCDGTRVLLEAPSSIESTCDPEGCPIDPDSGNPECECEDRQDAALFSMPGFLPNKNLRRPRIASNAFGSGFYPSEGNEIETESGIGARYIGLEFNDGAGSSMAQSDENFIIVSPFNSDPDNRGAGYLRKLMADVRDPDDTLEWDVPNFDSTGVKPHQYMVTDDHLYPRIIGEPDELIEEIVGIPDFNEDARADIAIGAPRGDIDQDGALDGAVYILYRRAETLEGNYELSKLKLDTNDPERLEGLVVREALGQGQRFGISVAGDFDFNHDGVADVVVGNPDGNGGTGEVVIIFGSALTQSEQLGLPVEDDVRPGLLTTRQGARIRGIITGDEFGLYVANIGDIDGDGGNDLAIAAPNATPHFDSNPTDANDSLDPAQNSFAIPGLDRDLDGVRDDVSGPTGLPNFSRSGNTNNDANDFLRNAGIVYIIRSSTHTGLFPVNATGGWDVSINQMGTASLHGFSVIGRRGERYTTNAGTTLLHEGDFLGGGNAGFGTETIHGKTFEYGGNTAKAPTAVLDASNDPANPRRLSDGSVLYRDRGRAFAIGRAGRVDNDTYDDFLLGAPLADPRVDPVTSEGARNGGEAYLIYGFTE